MEKLPEDVMIEKILLKLPANSLVNLRYVSKDLWRLITSPSFTKLHFQHSSSIAQLNNNNNHHNLLLICSCDYFAPFIPVIHTHACNFPIITNTSAAAAVSIIPSPHPEITEMHLPFESTEVRASCNGLLYLHQKLTNSWVDGKKKNIDDDISYYIWNPCTKEYKQLPPPPPPLLLNGVDVGKFNSRRMWSYYSSSGFCGFGYDRTNDEYKILHYENCVDRNYIVHADQVHEIESIISIIEFNLYTLGTNTWTRIAADNNPYRSFNFKELSKRIGFLVNGALHWIMSPSLSDLNSKGKIISFDIEKEVFQEVQKPRYYYSSKEEEEEDYYYEESLQTLQECLCMCHIHHLHGGGVNKIDIWMLQDYDVMDSWTKLFRVVIPDNNKFDYYHFRLLRYCENGEIVILRNAGDVIVYDPVNHKAKCAKKINESIARWWMYYMDYTESLVSLNSGTYTTDHGKKRHIDNTITNCIIDRRQYNAQKKDDSSGIICFLNGTKRRRTLTKLAS